MKFKASLTAKELFFLNIRILYFLSVWRVLFFVIFFSYIVYILVTVFVDLFSAFFSMNTEKLSYPGHPLGNILLPVLPLLPLVVFIVALFFICRRMKKVYKENLDKINMEYIVNEEGISGSGKNVQITEKWGYYKKLIEDKKYFMLQINRFRYRILPKRAMTPEQVEQFRGYAQKISTPENTNEDKNGN